jgi:hypothetical protein
VALYVQISDLFGFTALCKEGLFSNFSTFQ